MDVGITGEIKNKSQTLLSLTTPRSLVRTVYHSLNPPNDI